ncbi:hypothetical protein D9M72_175660 [compost metagenome]
MNQISDAFEDLAHGLRILLESHIHAHRGLLKVDRAEAVGNIENALGGALNAFSSLYDAMVKADISAALNWYTTPELATILVLRNARHHNHARKIRTMYSYYSQEVEKISSMGMCILVGFKPDEESAKTFEVYQSWGDLKTLFGMSRKETTVREETAKLVRDYLGADKFAQYAAGYELTEDCVFFNTVPLLVNAGIKVAPFIKDHVNARSMEARTYLSMFDGEVGPADTLTHEVACGSIALMP